jgi:F420-dependent oxidoreductase-like protein
MRIGLFGRTGGTTVGRAVEEAQAAAADGFGAFWYPQVAGLDALTTLAVIAREVPQLHLGTSVVPIQGRHPLPLAMQALTVADAAGPDRFTLGIGVTHAMVSEGWFGVPYRGIVDACAETLTALGGLLSPSRRADVDGSHVSVHAAVPLGTPPPGLVLAALAPRMVELAGRSADGTVTWMTGSRALAEQIAPRLRAAAQDAGRPAPRIIVGAQICVTDDLSAAREHLRPQMERSAIMPSYRRQLHAEGLTDPVDLALVGDASTVAARLGEFEAAGMTELCADVVGTAADQRQTREFLSSFAARRSG